MATFEIMSDLSGFMDEGGEVKPKQDCPHVLTEVDPNPRCEVFDVCRDCKSTKENWMCLLCNGVFCSRYVEAHGETHFFEYAFNEESKYKHCVSMSQSDLSIWCYACNSYVKHHSLVPVLVKAESVKFKEPEKLFLLDGVKRSFHVGFTCPLEQSNDHQRMEKPCLERPERLHAIMDRLYDANLLAQMRTYEPRELSASDIERVHKPAYVQRIFDSQRSDDIGDAARSSLNDQEDMFVTPSTCRAALAGAGSTQALVMSTLKGETRRGVALVRPPGHHATSSKGAGFCIFNNIALSAQMAIDEYGLERIMIIDFDIHHGNGCQELFYETQKVLHVSIHRQEFINSDGHACRFDDESTAEFLGAGDGRGYNVNIPLTGIQCDSSNNIRSSSSSSSSSKDSPLQSQMDANGIIGGDSDYLYVIREIILPLIAAYRPQLVLIGAGFDAGIADRHLPSGGFSVTQGGFALITKTILNALDELNFYMGKCMTTSSLNEEKGSLATDVLTKESDLKAPGVATLPNENMKSAGVHSESASGRDAAVKSTGLQDNHENISYDGPCGLVYSLEGGYDLPGLAGCIEAVCRVMVEHDAESYEYNAVNESLEIVKHRAPDSSLGGRGDHSSKRKITLEGLGNADRGSQCGGVSEETKAVVACVKERLRPYWCHI